ncbi:MAG: putative transporter [Bacteroidaceae bacterium]|nr:putative transporter [Bacteroidaceae bacterium]
MEFITNLFYGFNGVWSGGIAHSMIILALTIALGVILGRVKFAGISFGVTWILFVGIVFSHFGMTLNGDLLHFIKEFGLILFVYSIGLQVGPGFFSGFKSGGLTLNILACCIVFFDVITAIILHFTTGTSITTITGIMSGAVTNTPGLGAAQQAYTDMYGSTATDIALGYSVAYPLGVIGCILAMQILKATAYRKEFNAPVEEESEKLNVVPINIIVRNRDITNCTLENIRKSSKLDFVVSRIFHETSKEAEIANANSILQMNDKILVIAKPDLHENIVKLFGEICEIEWEKADAHFISRKIIITNPKLNGKILSKLDIRKHFQVNITRIHRSGIELVASPGIKLQIGDTVTVVGKETAVGSVKKILGDSRKYLDHPNLFPIFIGIVLGCILGSIPLMIPGIPQPVKLGLAGGPLIVSILISYFGPRLKLVTYTTTSANLMIREVGISLFLACVGLEAGNGFIDTIVNKGGYMWILYGAIITIIPLLLAGVIGRYIMKLRYNTLIGVMSGASTNPPALAFANEQCSGSEATSIGYATVYPLTMFMRVLVAQMMILTLC